MSDFRAEQKGNLSNHVHFDRDAVALRWYEPPFEQSPGGAQVRTRVNRFQDPDFPYPSVGLQYSREHDLALNSLRNRRLEIIRIDFMQRHRRFELAARSEGFMFGEPHDPASRVATDVGHLHGDSEDVSSIKTRVG